MEVRNGVRWNEMYLEEKTGQPLSFCLDSYHDAASKTPRAVALQRLVCLVASQILMENVHNGQTVARITVLSSS